MKKLLIVVLVALSAVGVSGQSIEIVKARGAAEVFRVTTARHGDIYVADTHHCGAPAPGPAYLQLVQLADGAEYRTLYANHCAYEAWSY